MSYTWGVNPITEPKMVKTVDKLTAINIAKLKNSRRKGGRSTYRHEDLNMILRSFFVATGRGDETLESLIRLFTVEDNPGSFSYTPKRQRPQYDYL